MGTQTTFISFIPTLSLIVAAVMYAPATSANKNYGPLISYTQAPLQSMRHTPTLRSGFPLEENKIEVFGALTAASVWANSHDYHLD